MAEFMARYMPGARILIPKPTWSNHHKCGPLPLHQAACMPFYLLCFRHSGFRTVLRIQPESDHMHPLLLPLLPYSA
jgi:hypothetical protein